jgi:ZIP family zinc transporter
MATRRASALPTAVIAALPLVLLGALLLIIKFFDPTKPFKTAFPPIEELAIERVVLRPGQLVLQVLNGGADPVTIAQVQVDDAYWEHSVVPSRELARLERATVTIPYPWVEGELHRIKLVTSTGLTFEKEIPVAVESPRPSMSFLILFAVLGLYIGVIPVALGLIWFPALGRLPESWLRFFLSLTLGLLVFLGIDALQEALEIAEKIPGAFQGVGLLSLGALGSFALLSAIEKSWIAAHKGDARTTQLTLAYMVAMGIGLHNLSEGLAVGAAYALGNIALGTMLVVGFTLHNTTEGLAIVAPIARTPVGLGHLAALGAIGGVPTVLGAWLGGFTYSPVLAVLFLGVGAGAIFQVVYQIAAGMGSREPGGAPLVTIPNVAGFIAGFLIMYGTGLLVAT